MSESKPREFTLHILDGCFFVQGTGSDSKNAIHVIEYSAYEELLKKVSPHRGKNWNEYKFESLMEDAQKLVEALESVMKVSGASCEHYHIAKKHSKNSKRLGS